MKAIFTLICLFLIIASCSKKEATRPLPKAIFTWANAGEGIAQFSSQSTEADTYLWDFGDASSFSTESNPRHVYAKNGKYQVSLTVVNPAGNNKSTAEIEVSSIPSPVASFTTIVNGEGSIQFVNESINAQTYSWDFGNGGFSAVKDPLPVAYTENKAYTVKLIAIGKGGSSTISKEITIKNIKPTVDFSFTESNGTVTFFNKSKNAESYVWDFGNGGVSTALNPVYKYKKTGLYTIKLTATGKGGEALKSSFLSILTINLTLSEVVDSQNLVSFLPGLWGVLVPGSGEKFNNYTYEFAENTNLLKYENYHNDYTTLSYPETTKINYRLSVSDNVLYTDIGDSKLVKHARFQVVSDDEMKFFRIIETGNSYSESTPFVLTRTSDIEKAMGSVINSAQILSLLKGIWDQGNYLIYNDVFLDFSAGKNFYNYNSTFQEGKKINKYEYKVDGSGIMSYRLWNSTYDPSWKKYKMEIVSTTSIKLYPIDIVTGKASTQAEYTLKKRP